MTVQDIDEVTFDDLVLSSQQPVLVDFWAPWCHPCRLLGPVLEDISQAHPNALRVLKVNIDQNPALASAYGIRTIPTMLVFSGGERIGSISGAMPRLQLERELRRFVPSLP